MKPNTRTDDASMRGTRNSVSMAPWVNLLSTLSMRPMHLVHLDLVCRLKRLSGNTPADRRYNLHWGGRHVLATRVFVFIL